MTSLLEMVLENFDAHLASDGHEVALACPLCGDHRERLFINLTSCLWTCHNCSESGNLIGFLERVMEKDPFEAYHIASKILPKAERIKTRPLESVIQATLPGLLMDDPHEILQRGFWRYLNERGITNDTILDHEMRFEIIGKYRGRVIIPIKQEGVVASFAARAIVWWAKPKELYPQGSQISHMLFGIDNITGTEVVLCEGIFDALSVAHGVATFGAHLAPEQRALLHRKGIKRVILMWDADPTGRKEAAKAVRELKSDGFEAVVARLPEGEDPASAGIDGIQTGLDFAAEVKVASSRHSIRSKLEE